jgi:hypothetical protein
MEAGGYSSRVEGERYQSRGLLILHLVLSTVGKSEICRVSGQVLAPGSEQRMGGENEAERLVKR